MQKFIELLVTCGYLGKIKYCPGTWGAILAAAIGLLLYIYCSVCYHYILSVLLLIALTIMFIIGCRCSYIYMQHYSVLDPKEIIIDEFVGQLLSIALSMLLMTHISLYDNIDNRPIAKLMVNCINSLIHHWLPPNSYYSLYYLHISTTTTLVLISLIAFRIFDILKPWPISLIDSYWHDGVGVMFDDVVAALMATLVVYILFHI